MATYIVNSNRLDGLKRGDIVTDKDLNGVNVEHLLDAGHLSVHKQPKPAKTITTDTKD